MVKVAGVLRPPELHLEGDFNLENYMSVDAEEAEDVANTEMIYFQAMIGGEEFDIRVIRVGGDEEAEAYKKAFKEMFDEEIPEDAVFQAKQFGGEPDMHGESFQEFDEVKERVREIFQKAREKHREEA